MLFEVVAALSRDVDDKRMWSLMKPMMQDEARVVTNDSKQTGKDTMWKVEDENTLPLNSRRDSKSNHISG